MSYAKLFGVDPGVKAAAESAEKKQRTDDDGHSGSSAAAARAVFENDDGIEDQVCQLTGQDSPLTMSKELNIEHKHEQKDYT